MPSLKLLMHGGRVTVYAVQKLNEAEPLRNPSSEQQKTLADDLRNIMRS
jgi:hypothetical protein